MKEKLADQNPIERKSHIGRDEMNLAEFPIAFLGRRPPKKLDRLVFTDTVYNEATRKPVTRTLTISASGLDGLPSSRDEDVILGLIQISAKTNFESPEILFTRYELIKLLGWKDDGVSYKRIEDSLRLWLGIHFYYDKAWWDKAEQSWVKEGFNLIDSVSLYDRERRDRELSKAERSMYTGMSKLVWGTVIYKSFQDGNLKKLDFDFYKDLESFTSKRMYRFLDKRFYKTHRLELDLRSFACSHLGLSSVYDNSNLMTRLQPAIAELEQKGFLAPLSKSDRFRQIARGKWQIVLNRASDKIAANASKPPLKEMQAKRPAYSQIPLPFHPIPSGLPASVIEIKNYKEPPPEEKERNIQLLKDLAASLSRRSSLASK